MKQLSNKTILVILGATLLLVLIATILLNPGRRLADERNNIRIEHMAQIVDAITLYAKENDGALPRGIPVSDNCMDEKYELCKLGEAKCGSLVTLSPLVNEYMSFMPVDPKYKGENGTGYHIVQSDKGRITVCAPGAELGRTLDYIK